METNTTHIHTHTHIKQAECAVHMAQAAPTQLCQLPDFQHILVELVVVGDREDNLVQPLQLLDVVLGDVPQLNPPPANGNKHENQPAQLSDICVCVCVCVWIYLTKIYLHKIPKILGI